MRQKNALNTSVSNKQKLKLKVTWFIAGVAFSLFLGVIIFLVFYGGSPTTASAEEELTHESVATGLWTSDATWKYGAPGTDPASENVEIIIHEGHEVTMPGDATIGENTTLNVIGTLVFREDLSLSSKATINIEETGILIVMGEYFASDNVSITNEGRSVVIENISQGNNSKIINNGTIYTSVDLNPELLSSYFSISAIEYNDEELKEILEYNGFSFTTLPVELGEFKAENLAEKVELKWTTLSEINNDYFTIERSADGKNFEILGTVNGVGDSKEPQYYSFTDNRPLSGTSYYILKQTDFDGQFEYFRAIKVSRDKHHSDNSLELLSVGPNPFQTNLNIQYNVPQTGPVEIQLMNLMGERVFTTSQTAYAGMNSYQFNEGEKLLDEIYILNLTYNGNISKSLKIVKR